MFYGCKTWFGLPSKVEVGWHSLSQLPLTNTCYHRPTNVELLDYIDAMLVTSQITFAFTKKRSLPGVHIQNVKMGKFLYDFGV